MNSMIPRPLLFKALEHAQKEDAVGRHKFLEYKLGLSNRSIHWTWVIHPEDAKVILRLMK